MFTVVILCILGLNLRILWLKKKKKKLEINFIIWKNDWAVKK